MSRTNETRFIEWHEKCKCECKFGANICNNKQRWNKYKCRCECKELIDKKVCNKGFIWNPSNCECDKACNFGEYLDYKNCKCRKKLVAPLIEECTETVEEVKLAKITLAEKENSYKCSSCTVYTELFWIFNYEDYACNGCHNLLMMAYSLDNIVILCVNVSFCCILLGISRNEALRRLNNANNLAKRGIV